MASDKPPLPPTAYRTILNSAFNSSPFQQNAPLHSPTSPVARQIQRIQINSPISTHTQTKRTSAFAQYTSHITNSPKKSKTSTEEATIHHYPLTTTQSQINKTIKVLLMHTINLIIRLKK